MISVLPGVGGVLPLDASAFPPKLPLDEPFVAYSLEDLAADACKMNCDFFFNFS